jgi:hypothetical protein
LNRHPRPLGNQLGIIAQQPDNPSANSSKASYANTKGSQSSRFLKKATQKLL